MMRLPMIVAICAGFALPAHAAPQDGAWDCYAVPVAGSVSRLDVRGKRYTLTLPDGTSDKGRFRRNGDKFEVLSGPLLESYDFDGMEGLYAFSDDNVYSDLSMSNLGEPMVNCQRAP